MAFGDDKSEQPTAKRKRESRKKGEVAKSADVALWAEVLVASFFLPGTMEHMVDTATAVLAGMRGLDSNSEGGDMLHWFGYGLRQSFVGLVPLVLAVMVTAVVSNVAQTGLYASSSLLKPKFSRANPIKGFKRLMSPQSVWQLGKMVLKTLILTAVAWPMASGLVSTMVSANRPGLTNALSLLATTTIAMIQRVAMAGLALAAVDYAVAQRRTRKSMRMSKQEVKEESKQSEGNPESKAGIKKRQMAIGRNRMISSVATATVVIVNPTHVAVALAYEPGSRAPKVVAKGKGAVAAKIKERAAEHGVPIVRDVPLARTLHDACDIDEEIPGSLYEAVARVLAFLYSVHNRVAFGGELVMPG